MIVVTGAAGFIGSNIVAGLNRRNYRDIVMVDAFNRPEKIRNYESKIYTALVERSEFMEWLERNNRFVQMIIHMGARTDTTEFNQDVFRKLNLDYSKMIFRACVEYGLPLIYASSAATYGMGELGYDDSHEIIPELKPLNPYGESKNEFDKWVLMQEEHPFFWAGLKFFNVFGPNEYHKGRMASVVYHAFNQIKETGRMKLFRSHRPDFRDGEQRRDFIYVKDVVDVILYLMEGRPDSGIYNLGSGRASTFIDLVTFTFRAMGKEPDIQFIDTPEDIRDTYQYFTEAGMTKLRAAGYTRPFRTLEEGVTEYVRDYLSEGLRS
ncbi:MAG: ADP-glyceromanno-heptose 6-epimerase [Bacteroidales bacterium]|nr:ADP-glyceromanno-heptose 6-epimerase [Bacteroidales bacterium]